MADKKITALTALNATGKVSSTDLLHIIDYSASPVNKKITVSDLLSNANTAISSYGAYTHDFGPTNAISGLSVVIPNATPAASAETEVVVNDDGNAFVDFRVETGLSASALKVDSSLDTDNGSCNTVTINGDFAKVDFRVNSDTSTATTPLLHCDSITHGIAIGKEDPVTTHLLDVSEVGSGATGKSANFAGGIDVGGNSTVTGSFGVTGSIDSTTYYTHGTVAHSAAGAIPVTHAVVNMTVDGTKAYTLPNGADGQMITLTCVAATGSTDGTISPVSSNFNGFATLDMDAVGETFVLMFSNSKWNLMSYYGGAVTT